MSTGSESRILWLSIHKPKGENIMNENNSTNGLPQYSLMEILGIWAGAALPMGLIVWALMPILIPRVNMELGFLSLILATLGLVWQGVFAFIILRREVKPFTWEKLKDRLWLYTPSHPRTGVRSNRMYLWTIPLIVLTQAYYVSGVLGWLDELWVKAFPFLAPPPYAVIQNLAEPAVGQWWLLGVIAVLIVFNFLLGEELIFRGILLPKMNGVFGKWDFIANGILFSTYHLHKIADWPSTLVIDWIYPWAAKRFKSYWVAVILHAFDAVELIVIFLLAIMGLFA
jgi:membrane protease YdiL (CAAX protease family)